LFQPEIRRACKFRDTLLARGKGRWVLCWSSTKAIRCLWRRTLGRL